MTTSPAPQQSFNLFSILAIVFVWFTGILGLIFGYIALSQIKRTGERGRGLALTAVIVAWIAIGLVILGVVLILVGAGIAVSTA